MECRYCKKRYSVKGVRYHEKYCELNPGRESPPPKSEKWKKAMRERKGSGANQYTKARKLGIPDPEVSRETREKISQNNKNRPEGFAKEVGKKISQTIQKKVKEGTWHTSLAKRMHYEYRGADLHGKWELAYAKYLDAEEIEWIRTRDRFAYEYGEKTRYYTPDFFLPATKQYIEIKGYKTEKDEAKWSQFPLELVVLQFEELKELFKDYLEISEMIKR